MRKQTWIGATLLGSSLYLTGCATPQEPLPLPAIAQTAIDACPIPEGWPSIEEQASDFVVFGETHGSSEAPALVADLVCALAKRENSVLLAVEHSSFYNDAFQQAWAGPADQLPAALAAAGWAGREDGVASLAMLRLVQRAHALKSAGHPVSIVTFNGARDDAQRERFAHLPGQGPHEAAQAENIADAAAADSYDFVIVLVGNLHAQKEPVEMNGQAFEPMAMRLAQYGSVTSLVMRSAAGETWNCQLREDYEFVPGQPLTSDAIECGAYPHLGNAELNRAPFLSLGEFPGVPGRASFDGYFWVGSTTASPPAFPE